MQISDLINVILCILSFILAIISVITVVITLKQNHKMIENSTRPYLNIYSKITNFQNQSFYLIIKNMGQTGAKIVNFKCDKDLSKYSFIDKIKPFEHIIGTFLTPGQSIMTNINLNKLKEDNVDNLVFNIEYDSGVKRYKEEYIINYNAYREIVQSRANTEGKELRTISYTLQDLVEKLL